MHTELAEDIPTVTFAQSFEIKHRQMLHQTVVLFAIKKQWAIHAREIIIHIILISEMFTLLAGILRILHKEFLDRISCSKTHHRLEFLEITEHAGFSIRK